MRQRAIERDCKLSEYGLFDKEGRLIPCKEESDIFKKLGLEYIPPEMREDRGEIEAAEKGRLPTLIEPRDIRGVFHVHSTWSDGLAPLDAMVAEAERLGWDYVGISDHSKSAAYAKGLTEDRVKQQGIEIEKLRKKFKIRIFWGTECDILKDGSLDYSDKVLANYDFVIASVHSNFTLPEAEMTARIIKAIKNKYVTILGHMTGRLIIEREGYAVDQLAVLKAAADEGVAVELNASPHRFDVDWRLLPKAKELGVKISINPDAHSVQGLHVVPFGVGIARKGWLSKEDVINTLPWPRSRLGSRPGADMTPMLWGFGLIIALVALLLIPNALYAFRRFMSGRDRVWFLTYMTFLIALGFLLVHIATRTIDIVQRAKEVYLEPDPEVVVRQPVRNTAGDYVAGYL